MPTDRKGEPIKAGDIVLVPAIVVKVEDLDEFHNIVAQTVESLHPAPHKTTLLLNSRQVEVCHPSIGVIVVTDQTDPVPPEKNDVQAK